MISFALSAFLDDLKPSHLNLSIQNMPLGPSTRDWTSLNAAKHRPVFCCCFDSGLHSLNVPGSRLPEVPEDAPHFIGRSPENGACLHKLQIAHFQERANNVNHR